MIPEVAQYVAWRASLYWLVGYSTARSGETPTYVDPLYQHDYEDGVRVGLNVSSLDAIPAERRWPNGAPT